MGVLPRRRRAPRALPVDDESVESSLAARREAPLRERPIKILPPADAHYAWTNVLAQYETHPYFKAIDLAGATTCKS